MDDMGPNSPPLPLRLRQVNRDYILPRGDAIITCIPRNIFLQFSECTIPAPPKTSLIIWQSSRPKAAIASVLGELEATRGDLEGARREFQKGLDRLEKAGTRKTDDWEGAEDPSEILLAWARLEEQVLLLEGQGKTGEWRFCLISHSAVASFFLYCFLCHFISFVLNILLKLLWQISVHFPSLPNPLMCGEGMLMRGAEEGRKSGRFFHR